MELDKKQKIKVAVAAGLLVVAAGIVIWNLGVFETPPKEVAPVLTPEEQKEADVQKTNVERLNKIRPPSGG